MIILTFSQFFLTKLLIKEDILADAYLFLKHPATFGTLKLKNLKYWMIDCLFYDLSSDIQNFFVKY